MYVLKSESNEKKHNIVLLGGSAQHTPQIKLSTPEIKLCNYSGRHYIRTTMSNDTATLLRVLVHILDFVLVPLLLGRYFFA